MKEQLKAMGQRLTELREINGVSVKEIAERLKISEEE